MPVCVTMNVMLYIYIFIHMEPSLMLHGSYIYMYLIEAFSEWDEAEMVRF